MRDGPDARAPGAPRDGVRSRWAAICGLAAGAVLLAGCNTTDVRIGPAPPDGRTVAFESVDGPPPETFHGFVEALSAEAAARALPVVSRRGPAAYRIRAYLAASVEGGRTSIAWAWDVYDEGQRRALRLSGEEKAGPAGRNAWNAAGADVLRRIARSGMTQLAAYLGSAPTVPAPPEAPGVTVAEAVADDFRPEASGIYRTAHQAPDPIGPAPAVQDDVKPAMPGVPLPRRRPTALAAADPPTLALAHTALRP